MAYNLESLVKILEQILHPHSHLVDPYNKKPDIEYLLKKTLALKQLFRNPSSSPPLITDYNKIQSLESRIRDAAYEAQDILESYLVDLIPSFREGFSFIFSPPSLQRVIGEFDSVEVEIKQMIMDIGSHHIPAEDSSSSSTSAAAASDPNPKKILVGLSQDSIQLMDRLTAHQQAKLEIIPIVGMGGIGKTTLAQYVYDDPLVVSHFYTRAWVTVSQEYNVRAVLLGLLECMIGKLTNEMREKQRDDQLAVHLHKSLYGRRYLIVLDDMWDNKAWDDVKRFFPDEEYGSRVMVTTRELSVADYVGSNSSHHQMHLLDENDSWDLLRQKVFAQDTCPPELEKIGEKIAENCRGLPLAIHVISGVLSQANTTRKSWTRVAEDVVSVVANNDEQFQKILLLSYNHLPNHLKPCFLYMSAFPEGYEVRSSKLIRLWVAEGFLEPILGKSLEEAAEVYLKALVDRNLIFVRKQETNGAVKSYSMHDLLRDLCVRKACQEKFLYIKKGQAGNFPRDSLPLRRVSVGLWDLVSADSCDLIEDVHDSMRLARSVLYIGQSWKNPYGCVLIFRLRLLRVLDILSVRLEPFRKELLQLVNLRYLAFMCLSFFPPPISTLSNLQTIILRNFALYGLSEGTEKIFDMPQLRHIKFLETYPFYKPGDVAVKENLQTLSGITVGPGFGRIIESVPNLKKLGIFDYRSVFSNIDLTCLRKLETLKVEILKQRHGPFLSLLILPPSLKKLTLSNCEIPLGYMNQIGTLPNLEVLKLRNSNLESSTWEPTEGEFSRLQFLLLERLNLVEWVADKTHFPRLKHLIVRDCSELEEISSSIGEILCLEIIEVHGCNPSAVDSARKIQEEQLELENDGLQVLITGSSK